MDYEPREHAAVSAFTPPLCGRPTRSGRPCRQRVSDPRFDVACKQHSSKVEAELAAALHDAYYKGYRDAQEASVKHESFRVEQLQKRISELEAALHPLRTTDPSGRQIVQVGRHAYAWDGSEPLVVGDLVWLPENWVSRLQQGPGRYRGEVTAIGTSYGGPLSLIIGRVKSS